MSLPQPNHPNYAPEPCKEHADLIDSLGGPVDVAAYLIERLGLTSLSSQAVSQWKRRGIPYRYRAGLAIRAREKDIGVPAGFLGEGSAQPQDSV